ncbi:23S ribosomal RNA methyltransferase Erm [Brevibacillus humidisoli]|uniref:23S ribosomal RNA methyltransferase Erm n=1 Tax=Brevibacillus humidisoli TaxID=2895522 RepID=UPI001E3744B9|nr:23S ribosomal RNA methyltransferase Erm [Brevibacillus humidisoli]UFJ39315.1 23S ribosomal RNA methyltransferase Erm [Brevibacillus humidisoli]
MNRQDKRHRKARKGLEGPNFSGQHLLHNKRVIQEMIQLAGITSADTVLEIGAGKGAFTLSLAERAKHVLAVEYDPVFVEVLRKKAEGYRNIKVIERDILKTSLPRDPFSVVASIPYSITTPILEKLLYPPSSAIQRAVLMIEYGAAKRFTANSIINPRILKWRIWFEMKLIRVVGRSHFSPPPRVDSAILRVRRRSSPLVASHHHSRFVALAEYGLRCPELPIYEALNGVFTPPQLKHVLRDVGRERDAPICSLNEDQWGVVFLAMLRHVEPHRWPKKQRRRDR